MNLLDLSGRNALVVGAGGLGSPIALGLAEQGADVAAADIDQARAEEAAAGVAALGRKSLALQVDVTADRSVEAMAAAYAAAFPRVDILVNCVGVAARTKTEDIPIERWDEVVRLNLHGTFVCCQVFGRRMIEQGGGKIVNVSSVRGNYGILGKGCSEYAASKGAINALTRALAAEWGPHNIYVNAVAPTVVETSLTAGLLADPEARRNLCATIPLGRWAKAEDVVGPVVFLASATAGFITGQILYIDGGLTAAV